ncbi:MAG TPA: hypothetical protein VE621_18730, partial [Bryobacteraceae bacterium]|nr:hypothetical protein [Bryobacteraceae bacterium]
KLKADPEVKAKFDQAIEGLRTRAERQIAAKPNSADAMFAMSIAAGLKGDYVALVERKQFSSWTYIKESNQWTVKLLATNPNYTDAYLTSGMTEYIVGSIPFFIRWMVKVDGVEGSKIAGVAKLKKVAESGRYFRPFAKILLAICSVREKKFDETRQLLTELTNEFPRNPQFKRELEKLKKVKGSATAAQGSPIDGQ